MKAPLIVYVDKGTTFDFQTLGRGFIEKWDLLCPSGGDSFGVVWASHLDTRNILSKQVGIHVVPGSIKVPKILDSTTITKFGPFLSVLASDTTMDLGEKLHTLTGMPWFHPDWEPS